MGGACSSTLHVAMQQAGTTFDELVVHVEILSRSGLLAGVFAALQR